MQRTVLVGYAERLGGLPVRFGFARRRLLRYRVNPPSIARPRTAHMFGVLADIDNSHGSFFSTHSTSALVSVLSPGFGLYVNLLAAKWQSSTVSNSPTYCA